ncbi:uncharacterized protein LOC111705910 [Eurytemora carolleeae]|uniref:uncharacterized protein LOC111705910 n=1 Tax=Eurytemora carolleeae TaxID=1294199 RepID=UPI000C77B800|nr:uncharacterized protein LOC111705910 [Eurytemora carolleeae]|eukprot:XP_023334382.1 uncharacterized protein LOC111705910 [Eurytemora affinis]
MESPAEDVKKEHLVYHTYEHYVPNQDYLGTVLEESEPPGVELLFNFAAFNRFEIYFQILVFILLLISIYGFSLLLHQWKLMRKIRDYIPESILLLIVGALLGFLGNLLSAQVSHPCSRFLIHVSGFSSLFQVSHP